MSTTPIGDLADRTAAAITEVFGDQVTVIDVTPIDGGRGVFSHVVRAELDGPPHAVAVKLLRPDANGAAALTSGAVAREIMAYEELLPSTPHVSAPRYFGTSIDHREVPTLVMADLSRQRLADQVEGLVDADVRSIVTELAVLHEAWVARDELDAVGLRRSTPSLLSPAALERGARSLDTTWGSITLERRQALQALANQRGAAVAAFAAEGGATLCHGDPRGDNVVFDDDDRAILLDWQQLAVQFGEADLAWLMTTSVEPDRRRAMEADVVASYAMVRSQDAATTWHRYRLGTVLPGLAVLLLAQRVIDEERTERFVRVSIERIAQAVIDLGVLELVSS